MRFKFVDALLRQRFNRYIVECKFFYNDIGIYHKLDLIDT